MIKAVAAMLLAAIALPTSGAGPGLAPVQVGEGAYAIIGDLGPPTYENGGLNANLGFVVTPDGVIVVDSGPSVQAARALHDAILRISKAPLRMVINTNAQPNRWHGNAYFRALGVPILAHAEAIKLMHEAGGLQVESMRAVLKEKSAGTSVAIATEAVAAERSVVLGGIEVRLIHFGAAHTRGDLVAWLPAAGILFAGDVVYTERLPAVIPAGRSAAWPGTFDAMLALAPKVIVPGHGAPTDAAQAIRDTRDYLVHLRGAVKDRIDAGVPVDTAAAQIDQSRFSHLANFGELSRRNAFQVYLEMEFE